MLIHPERLLDILVVSEAHFDHETVHVGISVDPAGIVDNVVLYNLLLDFLWVIFHQRLDWRIQLLLYVVYRDWRILTQFGPRAYRVLLLNLLFLGVLLVLEPLHEINFVLFYRCLSQDCELNEPKFDLESVFLVLDGFKLEALSGHLSLLLLPYEPQTLALVISDLDVES